jgi:hypothetical protein
MLEKTFEEMKELMDIIRDDGAKQIEKGNATAGQRARNASNKLGKLMVQYRKQSVEAAKK